MPWYYAVAERDHRIQNPTRPEKIRLLGEALRLGPHSRVLDVASGKAAPALILAEAFGCRLTCVERSEEFIATARERVREAGLGARIEIVHADAATVAYDREAYDAALCLGASFVWNGLAGTLAALGPAVKPGGHVVVGEPYWTRWPLPQGYDAATPPEEFTTLDATVARIEDSGLRVISMIASSADDWDGYETLHWRALEEWLAAHPDDPDAGRIREQYLRRKRDYLRWERELLGWAIFVGWKR